MKKFLVQLSIILAVSLAVGLAFNQLSKSPLPVFSKYKPEKKTDLATGEDLSVYYQEMDAETLDSLRETDAIVILDARTPDRYRQEHIPGAFSLPIAAFDKTYEPVKPLLEEGKSIVIYCIGNDCIDSSMLARELHKKGHREIFVYTGGIEEWKALGFPIQTPDGIVGQPGLNKGTEDERKNL